MAEGTVIEFTADLKALSEALNVTVATCLRRTALQVHTGVVLKTPVDTGRARGSWGISVGQPGDYVLPEGNYGGAEAVEVARQQQRNLAQVTEENPYQVVWVYNNLPYIEALENGHSQQAPNGMVVLTLAEVEAEIDAQLEAIAKQTLVEK